MISSVGTFSFSFSSIEVAEIGDCLRLCVARVLTDRCGQLFAPKVCYKRDVSSFTAVSLHRLCVLCLREENIPIFIRW